MKPVIGQSLEERGLAAEELLFEVYSRRMNVKLPMVVCLSVVRTGNIVNVVIFIKNLMAMIRLRF